MIIPALAVVAPLAAAGLTQYIDQRARVSEIDAVRPCTVVGTVAVDAVAVAVCGVAAEEARHRWRLNHLVKALNLALENDDAKRAAGCISQMEQQLGRKALPNKLVDSAERAAGVAAQCLGRCLTAQAIGGPRPGCPELGVCRWNACTRDGVVERPRPQAVDGRPRRTSASTAADASSAVTGSAGAAAPRPGGPQARWHQHGDRRHARPGE